MQQYQINFQPGARAVKIQLDIFTGGAHPLINFGNDKSLEKLAGGRPPISLQLAQNADIKQKQFGRFDGGAGKILIIRRQHESLIGQFEIFQENARRKTRGRQEFHEYV